MDRGADGGHRSRFDDQKLAHQFSSAVSSATSTWSKNARWSRAWPLDAAAKTGNPVSAPGCRPPDPPSDRNRKFPVWRPSPPISPRRTGHRANLKRVTPCRLATRLAVDTGAGYDGAGLGLIEVGQESEGRDPGFSSRWLARSAATPPRTSPVAPGPHAKVEGEVGLP